MFEKSALLMICCDISTKSFENLHLTCENSTKANKKTVIFLPVKKKFYKYNV